MIFQFQWCLLPLLILATSPVSACAGHSFLDQFRLQSTPVEAVDRDDLGAASPVDGASRSEHSFDIPAAPSRVSSPNSEWTIPGPGPLPDNPPTNSGLGNERLSENRESDSAAEFPRFDPYCGPEFDSGETPLIRYRDTCYQGTQAAYGVIPGGSSGLGIGSLDLLTTFAVPLGSMDHLISFMPFFRLDQLNAPSGVDLPDSLYEVGVKTFWKRVVNERLTVMALFTPSVRSDFDSSQQAFKLFGSAMLSWKIVPDTVSMFGGAMYTGRQDFPVLPTMGIYWTPSPLWKFDIQFPSPRISRRILKDSDFSETWAYVSGVFGGNTWAVKRASGQDDQLTLRDLRLMLGVEHLLKENRGVFVETGWVFSRSAEYANTPGQIDFGDAIILRAGFQF